MQELLEIGFIKVGEWSLDNGFHHTITTRLNQRNLLYSFTCDSSLLYIGKTTDTLKSRMNGYKNAGASQKTNIRVKGKIIEILQNKNKTIEIINNTINNVNNMKNKNKAIFENNLLEILSS